MAWSDGIDSPQFKELILPWNIFGGENAARQGSGIAIHPCQIEQGCCMGPLNGLGLHCAQNIFNNILFLAHCVCCIAIQKMVTVVKIPRLN